MVLAVLLGEAFADEISTDQATIAVENWIENGCSLGKLSNLAVDSAELISDSETGAELHVVKMKGGGFVVTAADDLVDPIIAFSETGDGIEIDESNPFWVLLKADIAAREASVGVARQTDSRSKVATRLGRVVTQERTAAQRQWDDLLERGLSFSLRAPDGSSGDDGLPSLSDVRVEPFIKSKWSQSTVGSKNCWNYYTPNNYVCGCTATAIAQMMRYWQYPTASVTAKSYGCKVDGKSVTKTMMGGTYAWASMPLTPFSTTPTDAQCQAIGKLAYDVGVTVCMSWKSDGSGASVASGMPALKDNFGYASAVDLYYTSSYNWTLERFKTAVIPNLDDKRPVALAVFSKSGGAGHALLADGYGYSGSSFYIHVNMGWGGGSSDIWYCPPDIASWDIIEHLLCNVSPTKTGNILSGRVIDSKGLPVPNASVSMLSDTTTLATTTTDAKGIYAFTYGKTGTFTVKATAFGKTGTVSGTLSSTKAVNMSSRSTPSKTGCSIGNCHCSDIVLPITQTFSVTLNQQNGSGGTTSVSATYGSAMPSITIPTRAGYAFGGYWTETNGNGTQYYTASGSSAKKWDKTTSATLYAKWTARSYTVTFNRDNGTGGPSSITATYDAVMPGITPPTRAGYDFGGYWTAKNGGGTQYYYASGQSIRKWNIASATTLYAKWTENIYTVTLNPQGGTGGTESVQVVENNAMPSIAIPMQTGYKFDGYWTEPKGGGTQYYTATGASARNWDKTSDMTLYAKWIPDGNLPTDGDLYVDAVTGDDGRDGRSWATAKASIQVAIDVSSAGDIIIVNNGRYEPIISNGKSITIRSVNGAEATIIDASLQWPRGITNRCATLGSSVSHTNTILSGFCLTNGIVRKGDGGGSCFGTLDNCVLSGNSADAGGGSHYGTLNSCVLSGNSAYDYAGSYGGTLNNCTVSGNSASQACGGSANGTLNNCIVWGNTAPYLSETYNCYGCHTCTSTDLPGVGNIHADPLFVDADNGNYRLQAESPCIDAGWRPYADDIGVDLAGQPRWQGTQVDMGAFESAAAVYSPEVRGATTFYVDARVGAQANSGSSWALAKKSIQDAIELSRDGDTILVAPGTYSPIATMDLHIRIVSRDGAETTGIDGGGVTRCATFGTTTNTVLQGFTLQNGNAENGGGSYFGTLDHCVLRGNSADAGGGSCSGALNSCLVKGNAARYGGGSYCGTLGNCIVSGNTALFGAGSYNGTLHNCTLSDNTATYGGGGACLGTLNNCIVWGNVARTSNEVYGATCRYLCSDEPLAGVGNIVGNPLFLNAANGDYRLQTGSPCIDTGANAYVMGETDFAGNPRVANGVVDIGAYEDCVISIPVTFETGEVTLNLKEGWNQISFSVLPDDASPANVFADVLDKIEYVVNGSQNWRPGKGGTLQAIAPGVGYWVKSKSSNVIWTVIGEVAPGVEIRLNAGWTMIGYPLLEERPVNEVLATAISAGKIERIVNGSRNWRSGKGGTLTTLTPGQGYWVYAPTAATITFDD